MAISLDQMKFKCRKCNRLVSVRLPHSLADLSAYCDNYSDDYEEIPGTAELVEKK